MAKNRFSQYALNEEQGKLKAEHDKQLVNEALLEVSQDSSGTRLSFLFNESEVKLIKEFLGFMREHHYKGALGLSLEVPVPLRGLSAQEMYSGSRADVRKKKLFGKIRWKTIWDGAGYMLGVTEEINDYFDNLTSSRIYVCTDGKLRCRRCPNLFKDSQSMASGFGRLPEDKRLFKPGEFKIGEITHVYDNEAGSNIKFQKFSLEELLKRLVKKNILDSH